MVERTQPPPDATKTVHGRNRRYRTPNNSKYDYRFVAIAERLVASGHSIQDMGYILGVSPDTIKGWKKTHPEFKAGCNDGKNIANAITLAQFLRCAWGVEYTERRRIYNVSTEKDENGNEVEKRRLVRVTEIDKYQPPNPDLLKFELINKLPEEYRDPRRIDITTKSLFGIMAGEPESAQIEQFFGLTKEIIGQTSSCLGSTPSRDGSPRRVGSFGKEKLIEDGKNRFDNAGTGASVDTKGFEPEHSLPQDPSRQAGEGQGDAEGLHPALPA